MDQIADGAESLMESTDPLPDLAGVDPAGSDSARPSSVPPDSVGFWSPRRTSAALVAMSLVPVVVATVRAIRDGWLPIGDNAFFGILARDVFSANPPLLGTWTSASLTVGQNVNNPGPLLFDLLAVPVAIFGTASGLALGVALVNSASIVGIGAVAHRRGGPPAVAAAMLVTSLLAWSMGSELLFDPWQPHVLLLAFLCFVMLAWSTSCGDRWAVPWLLFVGSFLVQTHLTYAYLVPALSLWAIIGLAFELRSEQRGTDPDDAPRRGLRRVALVSVVVLALAWLQPLIEQFAGDGTGNLTRLVQTLDDPAATTVGLSRAPRLMAAVLSQPPFWLRPSFSDTIPNPTGTPGSIGEENLPSTSSSILSLALLGALLALAAYAARRRSDRDVARGVITAVVALVAGAYTASRIPIALFGIAPHQFRWLWPVGAFTGFVLLLALTRFVTTDPRQRRLNSSPSLIPALYVVATIVVIVANLPKTPSKSGSAYDAWAIPVMADIDRQLGAAADDGPLLYDFREIVFAEPYSTAIMAELQRRDVEFFVDDEGLVRQLGPHRRYDGTNAKRRIFYRQGGGILTPPSGSERVAFHAGLTAAESRELDELRADLGAYVAEEKLSLTQKGRRWIDEGRISLARDGDVVDGSNVDALFETRVLMIAVQEQLVEPEPEWEARFDRYAELQRRDDRETIAVFVAPIEE